MSNRKLTPDARPAYISDRVKLALEGRPVTTGPARAAIKIHGGPDVGPLSRALLASYGVTDWETWSHASKRGVKVNRADGVEVQSVRQPDDAAWGFIVFPMGKARDTGPAPVKAPPASRSRAKAPSKPAGGRSRATRGECKPAPVSAPVKPAKARKLPKGKHAPLDWFEAVAIQAACDARNRGRASVAVTVADIKARAGLVPLSDSQRQAEIARWNAIVEAMPGREGTSKPQTMKPADYVRAIEGLLCAA